jgi:hypothetical protein
MQNAEFADYKEAELLGLLPGQQIDEEEVEGRAFLDRETAVWTWFEDGKFHCSPVKPNITLQEGGLK